MLREMSGRSSLGQEPRFQFVYVMYAALCEWVVMQPRNEPDLASNGSVTCALLECARNLEKVRGKEMSRSCKVNLQLLVPTAAG